MTCRIRKFFKNTFILTIILLGLIIIYFELCIYRVNTYDWQNLKCEDEKSCLKLLLVADPQIIGKRNEIIHILTPLSIWDIDKYLWSTYKQAFHFVKPDVVIFLGDLFDEGSIASDMEFNGYVRRLFDIFLDGPFASVRHIWLPGDNDIGGEGLDFVTSQKIQRFNRAFDQPDIIHVGNVSFYKINRFIDSIPVFSDNKEFFSVNTITVALSHKPLLFHPSVFVTKVLTKLQPHVLFTAHEHKSMIVSLDGVIREDRQIVPVYPDNKQTYKYTLGINNIYEIIVPTCSYRMGTTKIGYGYAVIEKDELQYTVLWSPQRFPQLVFYLVVLTLVLGVAFCKLISKMLRCRRGYKNLNG